MKAHSIVLLALGVVVASLVSPTRQQVREFEHRFFEDTFSLKWKVEADKFTFTAKAKTIGWVGIGLNEKGLMDGAELMLAGYNKTIPTTTITPPPTTTTTPTPTTTTPTTTTTTTPTTTTSTTPTTVTTTGGRRLRRAVKEGYPDYWEMRKGDDNHGFDEYNGFAWKFISATESDEGGATYTTVVWERKFTTNQEEDDDSFQLHEGHHMYVLVAFGETDDLVHHGGTRRESKMVDLFNDNMTAGSATLMASSLTSFSLILFVVNLVVH